MRASWVEEGGIVQYVGVVILLLRRWVDVLGNAASDVGSGEVEGWCDIS